MRVITYVCHSKYKPYERMAEYLGESAKKHGYEFQCYEVGGEDVKAGVFLKDEKKIYYVGGNGKPSLIKKALDENGDDLAFIDADCEIQQPFGDVLNDCDVAVTIKRIEDRPHLKFFEAYTNTGVIFFKNNAASRKFLELWEKENIDEMRWDCLGTDQASMNRMLLRHCPLDAYKVYDIDGIRVKTLKAEDYNFFYFPEDSSNAKVIHYKGLNFKLHPLNTEVLCQT